MVAFPNCKINLGLRILRQRPDGYHDLESVFYPLPVMDILECLPTRQKNTQCHASGLPIQGDPASNLCLRAWQLLKADFPHLPAVECWLHKIIPMGAGLGGGSADGAFLLRVLNDYFGLGLQQEQLIGYAIQLGSDCPFFILNTPCLATGRGEVLRPVQVDLTGYYFNLVYPGIHISTPWAFRQITPDASASGTLLSLVSTSPLHWKGRLCNDFEQPIAATHPEVAKIIDTLYASGAVYAAMSGSGSAVYGLFDRAVSMHGLFPSHYFVRDQLPAGLADAARIT